MLPAPDPQQLLVHVPASPMIQAGEHRRAQRSALAARPTVHRYYERASALVE